MSAPTPSTIPAWRIILLGRNPRFTLLRIFLLSLSSYFLFNFVLVPIRVTGTSMEPTYPNQKVNFINRLSFRWSAPQRGDVVGVLEREIDKVPQGKKILLLKRVVGLPCETVRISAREGRIYLNGKLLAEPYTHSLIDLAPRAPREWHLAANEYFIIGDNRPFSAFYTVTRQQILGKVLF